MKRIITTFAVSLLAISCFAQKQLDSLFYIFPEFEVGSVVFTDKTVSRGPLNINLFSQALMCINGRDTLEVDGSVSTVSAKNRMFYNEGRVYVELLESDGEVGLGIARISSLTNNYRQGAYGMTSGAYSTSTYLRNDDGIFIPDSAIMDRSNITYQISPYLFTKGKFVTPSKKAFQKAFPSKKEFIETFIKENGISFTKYEDVKALYDAVR